MTPDRTRAWIAAVLVALLAILAAVSMAGCGDVPPPRPEPVPAERESAALGDQITTERTTAAAAGAEAASLERQADATADPAAAAALRLDAERARLRSEAATAKAAAMTELRAAADRRASSERQEIDDRTAAAELRAAELQAQAGREADRRRAGWGLALAGVVAIALRLAGLPLIVAGGLPAAVAGGCLILAAWSSVPWLAVALGWGLAALVLVGGGYVLARVIREWIQHAADIPTKGTVGADAASIARQPRWLRWIIDHLLATQAPRVQAATRPAPAQVAP